jgi:hypothetical protein
MPLKMDTGSSATNRAYIQELKYLQKRLNTLNNLIRTLEQYDRIRPKPAKISLEERSA